MVNHRGRHPRRRSSGLKVLALTVVVALAVGGATGALAATRSDPALTRVFQQLGLGSGPDDGSGEPLPAEPAEFPDASRRYLPQVTASAIERLVKRNDFKCQNIADADGSPRGAKQWLDCDAPSSHGALVADMEVEHDGDAKVVSVSARCERGGRTQETYCPSVFVVATETVFANHPDVQEEAVAWAEQNMQNDAAAVIGGIQLEANLGEHRLTFVPEG